VRVAQPPRDESADHQPEQHGDRAEEAAEDPLHGHDQQQRAHGVGDVLQQHRVL